MVGRACIENRNFFNLRLESGHFLVSLQKVASDEVKALGHNRPFCARFVSNDRSFGCPVICTDTNYHPQQ